MARHCNGSPYCPNPPTYRGLCPTHARQANERQHPNATFYASTPWRKLRQRILNLEPNCRACGQTATQVDHITPISRGGAPLDPANLQPLCGDCHRAKTATEGPRPT